MKKILPLLALICVCTRASSQKKDFEGRLTFKVTTKSKSKEYDDNFYKLLLAANGDRLVTAIKNGMMKQSLGFYEAWYMGPKKRAYFRFKNIDTLYFRDYSSDTTKVIDILKSDSASVIQGFACKSITLKRENSSSLYLYTDALQLNTEYEKDNTIDNLNILVREIGTAMWLYCKSDYKGGTLIDSCLHIDQGAVDNSLFDLPTLPQKKISEASLFHYASFKGGEKAWIRYLQNNLNISLALKYVKIAKTEKTASSRVMVSFFVSADGSISNIEVSNKSEVDSHLANEAMRVIRESPPWDAATIYGIKTKTPFTQPIVFSVSQ